MNRNITNAIRFFLDELIPPIIRDNRVFMFPFYCFAYRCKDIKTVMNYKTAVYDFSGTEYRSFYSGLDSLSRNRPTDINRESLDIIANEIRADTASVLDAGCGKGFLLKTLRHRYPEIQLTGCDIFDQPSCDEYEYLSASVENLPFPDRSFDVVTCCHTLEHVVEIEKAVAELKRVTRNKLIIVVPCQREYFFTLDEHVNFFPYKSKLLHILGADAEECLKIKGDWLAVLRNEK